MTEEKENSQDTKLCPMKTYVEIQFQGYIQLVDLTIATINRAVHAALRILNKILGSRKMTCETYKQKSRIYMDMYKVDKKK